jgi:hypothetical protein
MAQLNELIGSRLLAHILLAIVWLVTVVRKVL